MSAKKQESIWTSFSRQQQKVATAHRPKRLLTELDDDGGDCAVDAADGVRVRSVDALAVVVKKRKVTATNDQLEDGGHEEGDAGIVTDGELLSSQEDYVCERRDTDFSVSDSQTDAVSDDIAGDEGENRAREDHQDSELEELSRSELVTDELTSHLVTPEKSHMHVKRRHADRSNYSPRTSKLPLHAQKEIKDSVHGLITFEPICMRIIDTLQFQRLRNLHQLGAANFVYIGATHTRFEHCLGVAYLAEQMVASIRVHQPWLGITDTDVLCIKIAGLCHDLGHGPFSHVFDGIFIKTLKRHKLISDTFNWTHEQGSLDMLDHLLVSNHISIEEYGLSRQDLTFIKELIYGGPLPGSDGVLHGRPASNQRFLYDFVNNAQSGLDVDKLDYFMRDALHTGAKASCDVDLLIRNARVLVDRDDKHGKMAICFPEKLSGQVMQAFHTRFDLHQSVYQHKAIRAIEYMICDVFLAANDHIKIKDKKISDIVTSMSAYQHLDDRVLARIQESDNLELAEAKSILNRMFTKPYYECVGKTCVTNHSSRKTEEMLLNEILCCSNKRHLVRERKNVIVEFMRVHFGKGDQDPLHHVRFYSKNACASATCYQIPSEAYEMYCPKTFQEHSIRVYVKEPRLVAPVREAFEAWSRKYNRSRVFPMAVAT